MPDPVTATSDGSVLVEHFYRQLAVDRVARAREALSAEPVERALSQSAQAFERAAAALEHALTVAPAAGELAVRLAEQAEALVLIAARFEQSADLARHLVSARRSRP
jgi:hypothetical protein